MRRSSIKETDFFKQTNILLSKKHRNYLGNLKKLTIMSNNITIDSSTFIRAMLDYLNDNPKICSEIKDYIKDNKGSTYVMKYNTLKEKNMSIEEIAETLGVEEDIINKISSKN